MARNEFAETTSGQENVTILRGPEPLVVDGQVIGTCQITREVTVDFKTKLPKEPREELVYLVCAPGIGRASKSRLSYAEAALEALGITSPPAPAAPAAPAASDKK